ncbi:hypothetical protein J4218_02810 [Candidatus Pacearchaeota archaeon]|nr:hypothetical protein [Candidatus Pacearchaeota archaeon]
MAKIQTLDELQTGDVVTLGSDDVFVVEFSGTSFPDHESRFNIYRLYHPDTLVIQMKYDRTRLGESQVDKIDKVDKQKYSGWKYLAIQRV